MARAATLLVPFVLASLALVPAVAGAGARLESRPAGISAAAWMPITRDLGFVIEQTASQNPGSVRPALGYFVVRRHGGWLRLDPLPQAARLRWPLRSPDESHRIPIADSLAFMVEAPASERGGDPASAFGYFVARRGDHTVRLDPMVRGTLFDGPLTSGRPGISVPISASLRFVIQQQTSAPGRARFASALGYFVIRQDGRSLRLNPIGSGQLLRQPL